MLVRIIGVLLIAASISCQKAQRDEDNVTNTCEDLSLAQTIFSDAYKQLRFAALNSQGISGSSSTIPTRYGCESITVDTLSDPKTITINYKFIGCEGMGVQRSGRLIGNFYGEFSEPESAVDIEFSNYFFQDYGVGGNLRIIFDDLNSSGQQVNTFYLQNGILDDGNGFMTWTASERWTMTDATPEEEVFSISGSSNGINRKGNVFFASILNENKISDDCLWIQSGSVDLEVLNLSRRTIDYGDDGCDPSGTAIINGANYPFYIPL